MALATAPTFYLHNLLLDSSLTSTVTASSANRYWPASNILNPHRQLVWQASAAGAQTLVFDLSAAQLVNAFAAVGYTGGGSVTIQGNSVDSWATPPVSEAVTVDAPYGYATFTTVSYRYWRLVLPALSNIHALGAAFLGVRDAFLETYANPRRYRFGAEITEIAEDTNAIALNGVERGFRKPTRWGFRIQLAYASQIEARNVADVFFRYRFDLPFFFQLIPSANVAFGGGSRDSTGGRQLGLPHANMLRFGATGQPGLGPENICYVRFREPLTITRVPGLASGWTVSLDLEEAI